MYLSKCTTIQHVYVHVNAEIHTYLLFQFSSLLLQLNQETVTFLSGLTKL